MSICAIAERLRGRCAFAVVGGGRAFAALGVMSALLVCGCQDWPPLVTDQEAWQRQSAAREAVHWDTSRPAEDGSAVQTAEADGDPLKSRVDQYISSIDSLVQRVDRYRDRPVVPPPWPEVERAAARPAVAEQFEPPLRVAPVEAVEPDRSAPLPPTVVAVEVRPAGGSEIVSQPAEPVGSSNLPLEAGDQDARLDLGRIIEAVRKQLAGRPNDAEKQLMLRVLYLLEGRQDLARSVTEGTNAELQQALEVLVEAMIAAGGSAWGADGDAERALQAIDDFRRALSSRVALRIPTLTFCRRVVSFGVYDRIDPPVFEAGREHAVVLYCEVDNFRSRVTPDGQFETLLTFCTQIFSAAGEPVYAEPEQRVRDLCRKRRNDFFIRQQLRLPATLSPGRHVVKTAITDVLGGKRAEARLVFRITDGQSVGPVTPLLPTATAPAGR